MNVGTELKLPKPIWLFQMPGEPEWLEAKDAETAGFLFKQTGAEIMEVYPADQVRAAILAERERCIAIVQDVEERTASWEDVGDLIAAAIRGTTSPEGK